MDAARQLLRVRTEVDRMWCLRALSAKTAVLGAEDEKVQLMSSIGKQFGLPLSESAQFCCKCWLKTSGYSGAGLNHDWQQVRLIVMKKTLLFDYEIFGPRVSSMSLLIHSEEVLNVKSNIDTAFSEKGMQLKIRCKSSTLELQISNESHAHKVLNILNEIVLHSKAASELLSHCPFQAPLVQPILATGKIASLSCGQVFEISSTCSNKYSFIRVDKGHFVLRHQGKVIRELIEGDVLGLPYFFLGLSLSPGYSLQAQGENMEFILVQVGIWNLYWCKTCCALFLFLFLSL